MSAALFSPLFSPASAALALPPAVPMGTEARPIGPGFAGFVAMFLLALATMVLIRSMVKHLRTIRYSPQPGDGEGDRESVPTGAGSDVRPAAAGADDTGKDAPDGAASGDGSPAAPDD